MAFGPGRWNRRSLLGMGGALVAARLGLGPQAASAGRAWCRSDPVALIDGQLADIFSSAPLDAPLHVTGPTQIVVTAPQGVNALLASPGVGFGRGENVRFAHSRKLKQTARGIQLKIAVFVPASQAMPIGVDFAPRGVGVLKPTSARGRANRWVTLSTKL